MNPFLIEPCRTRERSAGLRGVRSRHARIAVLAALAVAGAAQASSPGWQVNVYYAMGSVVSYQGHRYSALVSQIDYAGTAWTPQARSLWKELGPDSDSGPGSSGLLRDLFVRTDAVRPSCALKWNPANVYTSGGLASLDGVSYKANWWTQGENPESHSRGQGQPWTVVGSCSETSRLAAPPAASVRSRKAPTAPAPEARAPPAKIVHVDSAGG